MSGHEAEGDDARPAPDAAPGRLRWRCRRGAKELDLVLNAYLETRYPRAAREEREAFERLTTWSDPDLLDALLGRGQGWDRETSSVLEFLRSSLRTGSFGDAPPKDSR